MRRLWHVLLLSLTAAASSPVQFWARGAVVDHSSVSSQGVVTETDECDSTLSTAESTIQEYLKTNLLASGKFHVQGWRWHTMSLVREARRLGGLAQRLAIANSMVILKEDQQQPLLKAVDYVVDFNMKGLHKIETDLFVPWMRQTVQKIKDGSAAQAFTEVLDRLDQDRTLVAKLGRSLREKAAKVSSLSTEEARREVLQSFEKDAMSIADRTREMLRLQDTLLVPAVASLVSESEQKSFNNKVLRSLGLLDTRTHLVGMYEAVCEQEDQTEHQLFQEFMPYVPRVMIPRWKRLLYEPKAGVLDHGKS